MCFLIPARKAGMKSIRMAAWLTIAVLMAPWDAFAQSNSIYSWTDENGVRHFSDKAPANVEATHELIPQAPPEPAGDALVPADTLNNEPASDSMEGTTAAEELSYADQQRQAMAKRREADRQQQAERDRNCQDARNQLARVEPSRRVFYTDEDGETQRMDDEERVRLVEEYKKKIADFCD